MGQKEIDEKYMLRALELAPYGAGHVSPNPMVGAVIVSSDGKIIGEGWHRVYGGPHAEVNAFASINPKNQHLIPQSTIYVTLEPCSHYGKTPPCAKLLIDKGIRRCVIGCGDPNPKVSGRGAQMLRNAGIEVTENVLEKECRYLNRRFITSQTKGRPWIQLKWAQTNDGYIAAVSGCEISKANTANSYNIISEFVSLPISSPISATLMHRERAMADAILVGTNTLLADNPTLTTRLWPGKSPRPVIFDSTRLSQNLKIFNRNPIILDSKEFLSFNMERLLSEFGITSIMVEGGQRLLQSFLDEGLYDEIRIETSDFDLGNGLKAPKLQDITPQRYGNTQDNR